MSPHAESMLLNEIVPRFRTMIPRQVSQVGHEDHEELIQDSTAMAIKMLASAERRGKKVTASTIAHYTLLHARSGRRSYAAGSSCTMHPANRMKAGEPESLDYPVKEDECGSDPLLMSDVFSLDSDDPATKATRKMDWELFINGLNDRSRLILLILAEGGKLRGLAGRMGLSTTTIKLTINQLACQIREFFGADILKQIACVPTWRNNLDASRQQQACREERRPA